MKKILSIVIAAANLFNVITLAKAEGSYTEGDWVYSSENGNIIAWAGTDEDVVIPANSVVDSSFGFKNKGLMSEQKREYVNVKSL